MVSADPGSVPGVVDDAEMVEYLTPLQPHRYRAVRLLEVSGQAVKPKFGPRTALVDHTWH